MSCSPIVRNLDRYMDGELRDAEAVVVEEHLKGCEACRQERDRRAAIGQRLRAAARSPVDVGALERQVVSAVRRDSTVRIRAAAAAAVVVALAGAAAYFGARAFVEHTYLSALSPKAGSLMRLGLGDHIHCAHFRIWLSRKSAVSELVQEMDAQYRPAAALIERNVPKGYEIVLAHHCKFDGRRFLHFVLKTREGNSISVSLVRKRDGESFASSLIHSAAAKQMRIAGFETRDFLAFVVSDLAAEPNRRLAAALVGPMRAFFDSLAG